MNNRLAGMLRLCFGRDKVFGFGLQGGFGYGLRLFGAIGLEKVDSVVLGEEVPRKRKRMNKYHNVRPHRNPLADFNTAYPIGPSAIDWTKHFPLLPKSQTPVSFLDVGCGYGGLLVELSKLYPDKYSLGLEIRDPVFKYTTERILRLREDHPGFYNNISVIHTNAMKLLTNHFYKGQLEKMFFLFPDPHFKRMHQRRRIINPMLLADYAYLLRENALLYTATDVKDLYVWMDSCLSNHPLFQKIPEEEAKHDPCINAILHGTEEGKKVDRNNGQKYFTIHRRVIAPEESE